MNNYNTGLYASALSEAKKILSPPEWKPWGVPYIADAKQRKEHQRLNSILKNGINILICKPEEDFSECINCREAIVKNNQHQIVYFCKPECRKDYRLKNLHRSKANG